MCDLNEAEWRRGAPSIIPHYTGTGRALIAIMIISTINLTEHLIKMITLITNHMKRKKNVNVR